MARNRGVADEGSAAARSEASNPQASRETVESIVVAVILAFLFRAFVAEAFVIPTGSMAPTLQGRHLDLDCVQCGYRYRTGASMENESAQLVSRATCPICRYQVKLARSPRGTLLKTNQDSFNGDRILVSKFAYELSEPERWDVIVFKYPGNAKQNYIKRLVGLPGETILIRNGDVYTAEGNRQPGEQSRPLAIVRKPAAKVRAMLQAVDDTKHIGDKLLSVGWPSRWDQGTPTEEAHQWRAGTGNRQFAVKAGEQISWLRYRHLVPWPAHWEAMESGRLPADVESGRYQGQLITDYYAYNDFSTRRDDPFVYADDGVDPNGSCWVGDLSVVGDVEVQSESGDLLLDLVEGGIHYGCRIDVESGVAELTIGDGTRPFVDADGNEARRPSGATTIRGPGRHQLQFANVDDQLLLWVDSKHVEFDGPTTYEGELRTPVSSREDPGDLAPIGIAGRRTDLRVTRLQVFRDVYYQAVDHTSLSRLEYGENKRPSELRLIFSNPDSWPEFFHDRPHVEFSLGENQFFPLGDNSPQSKDARLWADGYTKAYVERRLLLGKALLIYWPHAWRPFLPNFARMGLIR